MTEQRIESGWCCLWATHAGGVGVPCVVVGGVMLCEACHAKHQAQAAEGRKGAA